MINENLHKYSARKNRNKIIMWSWNNAGDTTGVLSNGSIARRCVLMQGK